MENLERFVQWAKLKIRIHAEDKDIYFREKEIWWASLGMNIGFEQNGKHEKFERPVLVLKKFGRGSLWILPLTSKQKSGRFYYRFNFKERESSVIISQLRMISSKRLLRRIGNVSREDFDQIRQMIKDMI